MLRLIPYLRHLGRAPLPFLGVLAAGALSTASFLLTAVLGKTVYDRLLPSLDGWLLARIAACLVLLLALSAGASFLFHVSRALLAEKAAAAAQLAFLRRALGFRYRYFLEAPSGQTVKALMEDADAAGRGACGLAVLACTAANVAAGLAIFQAVRPWLFQVYALVIGAFLAWYALWQWPIARSTAGLSPRYSAMYSLLWEYLRGLREAKLSLAFPYFRGRWERAEGSIRRGLMLNSLAHACFWVAAALPWIAFPVVLAGAVREMEAGTMTIGLFAVALSFLWGLFDPLIQSVEQLGLAQSGSQAAARLAALPGAVPEAPGRRRLAGIHPGIRAEGLTLDFGGGQPALSEVGFTVPAGARVGLVGSSGSGKTTLLNVLVKLHEGYRGSVSVGGLELRDIASSSLRARVAYLPQEPWLIKDSLRRNIDPEGRVDDAALAMICRRSGLEGLMQRLPGGLDGMVLEGGGNFSGGERQRIALARCLAREAEVFLLDEPTAALDPATEAAVWKTLKEALAGKTVITVTHRLHLLRDQDSLLVLDQGRLVQSGGYAELAARQGGRFHDLLTAWEEELPGPRGRTRGGEA